MSFGRHHHVLGLEVAVHHAQRVGGHQGLGHLDRQPQALAARARLPEVGAQRAPPHQLEDQEVALGRLDVLVEAADAGVLELREHLGLAQQAGPGRGVQAPVVPQRLDRDPALQAVVQPQVDVAHPALAEALDQADAAHAGARQAGGRHQAPSPGVGGPFASLSSEGAR